MVSERRSRSKEQGEGGRRIGSRDWRWRRGVAVPFSPERKRSRTIAERKRGVAWRGREESRRLGIVNL
ncbi:unnamed protein product [Linum trigynum]|uniref:Uncharacterized protein n=1 Tax=Linum trigynum TaxID=586398 RepID=A0AAV2EU42_9ROSI